MDSASLSLSMGTASFSPSIDTASLSLSMGSASLSLFMDRASLSLSLFLSLSLSLPLSLPQCLVPVSLIPFLIHWLIRSVSFCNLCGSFSATLAHLFVLQSLWVSFQSLWVSFRHRAFHSWLIQHNHGFLWGLTTCTDTQTHIHRYTSTHTYKYTVYSYHVLSNSPTCDLL